MLFDPLKYINEMNAIHNNQYDYDINSFVNTGKNFRVTCKRCGRVFMTSFSNHLYGRHGCTCIKSAERLAHFKSKCNKLFNGRYVYDDITHLPSKRRDKISIYCTRHDNYFKQAYADHMSGRTACVLCTRESRADKFKSNTNEFIKKAKVVHGDKYDYSLVNYERAWLKVKIICKADGNTFTQTPNSHLRGHGCPLCSNFISRKEKIWLDSIGIPNDQYHRQVLIELDNKLFNVDGYIPDTKTVYEFNGDFWHGNLNRFDKDTVHPYLDITYGELYKQTKTKEQIFKDNGYKVISIWESDFDKLSHKI
jgi:hypothetical protein